MTANDEPFGGSDAPENRLTFTLADSRVPRQIKQSFARAARALAPTLIALTFAGVAHAQGTMDFSGAQTLMGTFNTSRMLADLEKTAVILQSHLGGTLGLQLLGKAEAFQFFSYLFNLEE